MNILEGLLGLIGGILQLIGLVLFKFYGWVVVVAVLGYLIVQNRRREQWVGEIDTILLRIDVPKDNEKKELSAEQMFASLHGILRPKAELVKEGSLQEHVSFEIVARERAIQFYVWCPRHLKDFVESQIYAQYPTVQIQEGPDDYAVTEVGERSIYGTELQLTKPDVLPIQTFASFEVDPLAGITGVLAKLEETGEEAWIQILARPIDDAWQDKGKSFIEQIKNGKSMDLKSELIKALLHLPTYIISNFLAAMFTPPGSTDKKGAETKKAELSTGQQTVIKAVEEKINKLGYEVKVRLTYVGPDEALARARMQALVGGFKQFNTTNLNGFTSTKIYTTNEFLEDYRARLFLDSGYILNIEEIASLYHLPHKSVETPSMVWTTSKTSEPPANIPAEGTCEATDVSLFGLTNFRGRHQKFGIMRRDRGRHIYIIGQTGAGKSMLLQLITLSDVYHDAGFAIIDPHGDYATDIMKYIPEHRLKDVVYFNATDTEFPMAFNPMEVQDENLKNHISSELVGVLKRMFENSWGPRLEYILRYAILALLDYPGATMLDITRMLTEKDFRKKVVREIQDPVVRTFWTVEFTSWNDKFASEAVAPILNKVGAFVANPLVRNIIGQQKSAFNVRQIMDEGKIFIVNLSRGQVGEDNAAILGALMVTKIQLAAMSRADMPLDQRKPFYLYVDEFQNFATDSFAVILSEARKYGLCLTVANQYTSQMIDTVRDAVFGNVGTMVTFRVGPEDSAVLAKYYEPVFEAQDITRLNNQNIFISMIIKGEKAAPFSARTLRMPDPERDLSDEIIKLSRERYATPRATVVEDIRSRTEEPQADQGARAVDNVLGDKKSAIAGTIALGNQKPNTLPEPKSEFLAALKNPDLPPSLPAPRNNDRGRGDGQSNRDRNRNDRNDRGDRRGGGGGGNDRRNNDRRPGGERGDRNAAPRDNQRDQAIREAIQAAQAKQASVQAPQAPQAPAPQPTQSMPQSPTPQAPQPVQQPVYTPQPATPQPTQFQAAAQPPVISQPAAQARPQPVAPVYAQQSPSTTVDAPAISDAADRQ